MKCHEQFMISYYSIILDVGLLLRHLVLDDFSSSKKNEHGYHVSFFMNICALGFVLLTTLTENGNTAMYVSIYLVHCGAFAAFPILLSWLTKNVGGHT